MVAINLRLLKCEFYSNILIKDFPFICYTLRHAEAAQLYKSNAKRHTTHLIFRYFVIKIC